MRMRLLELSIALCAVCMVALGAAIYYVNSTSRTADQRQIDENTRRSIINQHRGERNCLRSRAIVHAILKLNPSSTLPEEMAVIDARYKDVRPCPVD